MPNRRRVVLGIAGLCTFLVGSAAVVQHRATICWSAMEREASALRAEVASRDHRREPAWGSATTGRAFEHYDRALALARPLAAAWQSELVATLRRSDAEIATDTAALRALWQPALAALRAGAHADDGTPRPLDVHAPDRSLTNLLDARWLVNVAMFEARALRHAGHYREAVEWSLDAATLGADHLRNSLLVQQMIGIAMLSIATGGWWPDDAVAALDAPALAVFAAGLARLDAGLPERLDLSAELLWLADWLQRTPPGESGAGTLDAWRYGFSSHWMAADAFVRYAAVVRANRDEPQAPWPDRRARLESSFGSLAHTGNRLLELVAPNLTAAETNLRETLANLRLLRAALAVRAGGDVTGLRDPLGSGPFAITAEDGGTRIRSAGSSDRRKFERFVRRD